MKHFLPCLLLIFSPLFWMSVHAQPANPACKSSAFQKLIGGHGDDYGYDIKESIEGNGYILAGSTTSAGAGGSDAFLMRTDSNGVVLWGRTYGSSGNDAFYNVIKTSDNNYVAVGWCRFDPSHVSDIFVAKISPGGGLIWAAAFGAGTQNGEYGHRVTQTEDGGFVIAADYNTTPTTVQPLFLKLDANGSLQWAKLFTVTTSGEAYGIVSEGGYITGAGVVAMSSPQSSTLNDGYLVKMRSSDGSLVWTKNVESEGRSNRLMNMTIKNGQYVCSMFNANGFVTGNTTPLVFVTDTSANLIYSQSYEPLGFQDMAGIGVAPTGDGGYIASLSEIQNNTTPRLVKIGASGSIDWEDDFTAYYSEQLNAPLQDPNNSFVAVGAAVQTPGSDADILLVRTDALGMFSSSVTGGCQITHSPTANNPIAIQITDQPANYWSSISDGGVTASVPNVLQSLFNPTVKSPCDAVNYCAALKITGRDTLCDPQSPSAYQAVRSPGCGTPVQWTIDPQFVNILSSTDSTLQLQFIKNGTTKLYGMITTSCSILRDSLTISALAVQPIQLGNDTTICNGDSLILDAGAGFRSYLWSTGAVSEKIKATRQGSYIVAATNNDLCISRDTLDLQVPGPPMVNIGPDSGFICTNTVHVFDAGNSFSDYLWQDGSTQQTLTASVSGTYWVQVMDAYHCVSSDTTFLSVKALPAGFLLPSADICSDDDLGIKAIGNWTSYLWSNGGHGDSTVFSTSGQYWLEVTDSYGCAARDTITLVAQNCPRQIYFPNAFTPNHDGHNDIFKPIVIGTLKSFRMIIYDRWGVRVFETRNAAQGWDGYFNGKNQDNNLFVWYAVYQFSGRSQRQKNEKGTLMLIR